MHCARCGAVSCTCERLWLHLDVIGRLRFNLEEDALHHLRLACIRAPRGELIFCDGHDGRAETGRICGIDEEKKLRASRTENECYSE